VTEQGAATRETAAVRPTRVAQPITEIQVAAEPHAPTGIAEFDRVLGGGLVAGAAVLVSGEPGVGKSTLLLSVAAAAAQAGRRVLYVSAEESLSQVTLRARRIGAMSANLYLASESDLATILGQVTEVKPQLLIVDSVQTVTSSDVEGSAGMPSQVREVAGNLVRVAKASSVPLLLVGHVTKDGSIAGPRTLEHLVDVVCHFEGDRQTSLRFIRTLKNRFGPTDEVGCFEMQGDGIAEVSDPSALFLSKAAEVSAGSCVTVTIEGKRPIIVELQALVVKSSGPQPRRVTNGVDASRVAMVLAVLERRAGVRLADSDVYVSTVGGYRLTEPAADLAIALALASAASDKPIADKTCAFGEISLAGEVRAVTAATQRKAEAGRLGYTRVVSSEQEVLRKALTAAFG
jgi:DNA repair protein RadA/Sms